MSFSEIETDIRVGALVGAIPTLSMLLTALFAVRIQFSTIFESTAQNFCAGLILGAVAKELFPLLGSISDGSVFLSVTIGFFFGLFFIHFLDFAVDFVEHFFSEKVNPNLTEDENSEGGVQMVSSRSYHSIESRDNETTDHGSESGSDHDAPILLLATQAIASPMHKEKIRNKVSEIFACITNMEQKSSILSINLTSKCEAAARDPKIELVADQIDEDIHKMQYSLDHCRRLIQGTGSDIEAALPRIWITEKGKNALGLRLEELKQDCLLDCLNS